MTAETVTLEALRADIAAMVELASSAIGDDDNLMDIGLDSMRAMNLVLQWGDAGIPLDFPDLVEAPTLAQLWAIVRDRQGAGAP
ncbi:MAG: phosphopantetheine-binding protein [Sphingobium sp.]